MGQRNPNRIGITERHNKGRTVADMAREGWDVISRCQVCGLMMQADLKLIAYVSGPNTSLWNRKARCRRLLCPGFVSFHARAPGMLTHHELSIDPKMPDEPPAWLRGTGKWAKE